MSSYRSPFGIKIGEFVIRLRVHGSRNQSNGIVLLLNVVIICIGDQGVSSASDYIRKNEINHIRHMELANVKIDELKLILLKIAGECR